MAISKIKTGSISDSAITEAKLGSNAVTTGKISDGTIVNADISPSAAIAASKTVICTAVTDTNTFNISLLGFKMAVNEGLTVFNLVDGVVDEFHDESGTDEAEGSNDTYNATSDFYVNSTSPTGVAFCSPTTVSAGFSTTTITEADTSVTQSNPTQGAGTAGTFTVPTGLTSLAFKAWGAGGGGAGGKGGGGGFVSGNIAVTAGQVLEVTVGEGAHGSSSSLEAAFGGVSHGAADDFPPGCAPAAGYPQGAPHGYDNQFQGGGGAEGSMSNTGLGGGLSGVIMENTTTWLEGAPTVPAVGFIAGGGGGGSGSYDGGAAGGLTGDAGGTTSEQTCGRNAIPAPTGGGSGGGGDQEQGGGGGDWAGSPTENGPSGQLFAGGYGGGPGGAGGAGYYGGAGASQGPQLGNTSYAGGGGSSYYGHPQVTSGATEEGAEYVGGGISDPDYVACTNEGGGSPGGNGEDGFVLLTGSGCTPVSATTTSTTIVSTAFASTSVPTTSRIVVFEERISSLTLNTDIIASVSRDGGSNFTTATLSDSGYVTGSSGQRILTGQATISGQPSGQSMRWKLALANNAVKIHGVSLQWA